MVVQYSTIVPCLTIPTPSLLFFIQFPVSHLDISIQTHTHWDYVCPLFFTLSVNLSSSPENKKDKTKSAKTKPLSNSSLSETNEGIAIFNTFCWGFFFCPIVFHVHCFCCCLQYLSYLAGVNVSCISYKKAVNKDRYLAI